MVIVRLTLNTKNIKQHRSYKMKRDEILETIRSLAQSQGSYGRLLQDLENMPKELSKAILTDLEAQNFKDAVDLVLYIEG